MKKLFKAALIAVCILSVSSFAKAQVKIGYLNMNDLITAMPELKTVQTQMQAYQKTFVDVLTGMNNEFNSKGSAFQAKQATMTDAAKTAAQGELGDLQKRIQDYQTNAQQQVEAKQQEYMKPLYTKATNAINAVAKERSYGYVLDSSSTQLLVKPDGDDIMAAVKLKLGLK
jgi:outer membrane protein